MADTGRIPRPLFGQIAIMAEFCTKEQVNECLKIQNKGKKTGTHFYLGSILINKGYLKLDHALQILRYQKVQIMQDPSNNYRYNIHDFSNKKKYRSPESRELLILPISISTITVRGDMGLKKVNQESLDAPIVPGTLFDIENLTYEMELGGTSVDITSLNLEVDPFTHSTQSVSFDDVPSQSADAEMLDPLQSEEFNKDPFDQPISDFPDAEPVFPESDPFGAVDDDPFASSVDVFNNVTETEEESSRLNSKFPSKMNSSFYIGGSGSEGVEARQDDEEWSAWEESDEPKDDEMRIDRTLDGPVMAELSTEEKAFSNDFDLEDGATLMDSDAGVAMGDQLRDLVKKENIDFSAPSDATTFEDAIATFDKNESETVDAEATDQPFEMELADDPFAQVSEKDFDSAFDEEITKDLFATDSDGEEVLETVQDKLSESQINESWDMPDIEANEESAEVVESNIAGDIEGAQFWDADQEQEVEELVSFDEFEKITSGIGGEVAAEGETMQTLELFTSEGELQEVVREEFMKEPEDELEEKAVGALGGEIAQAEGALGGEIAQAEGELEGEVLDLTSDGTAALLAPESGRVHQVSKPVKRKSKKGVDYVDDFTLDEVTALEPEGEGGFVREEKTDVDIQYVHEEKTDLDIKRPSGWRSLFYGRRASDAKAKVNLLYFFFFLIGLAIISGGIALLTDFVYRNGQLIEKYTGFINRNHELKTTSIPDEVWNELTIARRLTENFEFKQSIPRFTAMVDKYPAYKSIFQSDRTSAINKQDEAEQEMDENYQTAIKRTPDVISLRESLQNTNKFIEKYSQKPYSNLTKSEDYIKNAQDEIRRIQDELREAEMPGEEELKNRLRKVAAWTPDDLLDNEKEFEARYMEFNALLKDINMNALPFWKAKDSEIHKRVNERFKVISDFFEKEVVLCDLLIKENTSADFDIKNIWRAIAEVKASEKIVRKYDEFDSVLKTDWILEKKRKINDEYVNKVYSSLEKSFDQVKSLSESEYKRKIDLLKVLLEDIDQAKTLDLQKETREAIDGIETEVKKLLTDLIRYSNYADWRNKALENLEDGNIDVALEYFEKIHPFTEDANLKEIIAAYKKCQFLVVKRDAPAAFEKALMYNANLNSYSAEQLMQAWTASYDLFAKMYELLFDEDGNLFEYTYDDEDLEGFDIVNDCIENRLITEALKYLWTAQYQYEVGNNERNFKIFETAKENYKKALPYFLSHSESYEKQVNEIQTLIVKCEYEPLKLESKVLREKAIEFLEMNVRTKAEEALRLTELSDELWHDALAIEQENEFFRVYEVDSAELVKIAELIEEIKRAIRRHIYEEKLEEALMYEQNEDFDRAVSVLETAKMFTKDQRWANKFIKKLKVKELIKEAKAFADKEDADYAGAIELLDKAAKINPLETQIYVLKNKYSYMLGKSDRKKKNASEMSLIKGGTAILTNGSEVDFEDYYIDKHEVTNEDYANFLKFLESVDNDDSTFRHPKQPTDVAGMTGFGKRSHQPKCWGFPGYNDPNQPVVGVTFWDAYAYAKWAGKRLPTASEWEYASAGKDRRLYPWGGDKNIENAFCAELAKKLGRSYPMLVNKLVKSAVSGTEILHMAGNVREWTALANEADDTAIVKGGSFRTLISKMTNGFSETLKIGGWDDATGFRCVMDK